MLYLMMDSGPTRSAYSTTVVVYPMLQTQLTDDRTVLSANITTFSPGSSFSISFQLHMVFYLVIGLCQAVN